jgi:hypothetical protein
MRISIGSFCEISSPVRPVLHFFVQLVNAYSKNDKQPLPRKYPNKPIHQCQWTNALIRCKKASALAYLNELWISCTEVIDTNRNIK